MSHDHETVTSDAPRVCSYCKGTIRAGVEHERFYCWYHCGCRRHDTSAMSKKWGVPAATTDFTYTEIKGQQWSYIIGGDSTTQTSSNTVESSTTGATWTIDSQVEPTDDGPGVLSYKLGEVGFEGKFTDDSTFSAVVGDNFYAVNPGLHFTVNWAKPKKAFDAGQPHIHHSAGYHLQKKIGEENLNWGGNSKTLVKLWKDLTQLKTEPGYWVILTPDTATLSHDEPIYTWQIPKPPTSGVNDNISIIHPGGATKIPFHPNGMKIASKDPVVVLKYKATGIPIKNPPAKPKPSSWTTGVPSVDVQSISANKLSSSQIFADELEQKYKGQHHV